MAQLTQEELQSIKDLQARYNQTTFEVGSLEIQLSTYKKYVVSLEEEKANLLKDITSIEEKEKELTNQLVSKYGNGNINSETGEITPA
jgi:chromosome segregation ATPase